MPENIENRKVYSLLEVTTSIEKTLASRYASAFWVKAELLKLNHYPKSGHCYPDLVDKSNGTIVAQIRANLWNSAYQSVNQRFIEITGEPLREGINILFLAMISFHSIHGLTLNMLDIDPGYTLGDMMREKLETIRKLTDERLADLNKRVLFPLLPQRVAVISVETSKGYSDFRSKIDHNPFGYRFFYMLFPSLLQGENAVTEMVSQLHRIRAVRSHFDVVAIIRGGGGDVGLHCYNNYTLAREIALFPLPVLTGIGHSTNETVVQMVAYKNNITPTDVADFLIQKFHNFKVPLEDAERMIVDYARQKVAEEKKQLHEQVKYFKSVTRNLLLTRKSGFRELTREMRHRCIRFLQANLTELGQQVALLRIHSKNALKFHTRRTGEFENLVRLLDPVNVLKRGYSVTYLKDRVLLSTDEATTGDRLVTELYQGKITSIVESTNKHQWKKNKPTRPLSKNLKKS